MNTLRRVLIAVVSLSFVGLGGAAMTWLIQTKPEPPVQTSFSNVLDVAVATVRPSLARVPVVGYGTVRPKNQIHIIPQVSGKLLYTHKDLAQGKIIKGGERLFEIDPTIYDARVLQVEAEIRGLEATLKRHDQEIANLDIRITNVEEMLAIDKSDHTTSKNLYETDHVGTQRDVDLAYQKLLARTDVVVELRNRRAMAPHLKLETQAQLDAGRARLKQAEHNLKHTTIRCPFDARVESIGAYTSQVVTAHLSIATLTDMEAFEISVGIDPRELRWLSEAIRPSALERGSDGADEVVAVRWSLPDQEFTWHGYVSRFERVDEVTRTARMVIEVREADMTARMSAGSGDDRPTLSIGMHCRAELPARPLDEALLVPRHAIYDHRWVYVFESDPQSTDAAVGRLARREVPMLRSLGEFVLVDHADRKGTEVCELKAGDALVVSPLTRPVVGMAISLRDQRLSGPAAPAVYPPFRERRPFAQDAEALVLAPVESPRPGS